MIAESGSLFRVCTFLWSNFADQLSSRSLLRSDKNERLCPMTEMRLIAKYMRTRFVICCVIILSACALSYSQSKGTHASEPDYCAAVDSAAGGRRRTIRMKALMTWSTVARVDGGDTVLYSPRCNSGDYFANVL